MWISLSQAGTFRYSDFSPFCFTKWLKMCYVAQGSDMNSSFEFLSWIQIRALTWRLHNIYLVSEPFLCSFCCMLGVVVLLEKKSPLESHSSLADRASKTSRNFGEIFLHSCSPLPLQAFQSLLPRSILRVQCCRLRWSVWCSPNMLSLNAKNLFSELLDVFVLQF